MIVTIEYVEHDPGDEGATAFFGRVIATSDVRGMTPEEVERETAEMKELLGAHVRVRVVEEVGAA